MTEKSEQILVADPPTRFRWGTETHVGMERQENQDNFFADRDNERIGTSSSICAQLRKK